MPDGREGAFNGVRRSQVLPVLGREVLERPAAHRGPWSGNRQLSVFDLVGSTKASKAATASYLVSAIQTSCSARLALVCRLFGSLFRMSAVVFIFIWTF